MTEFADLTICEFVSQYLGFKPNNVRSGLKLFRTHGYVNHSPCGCCGLDLEGIDDACEEPATVRFVLGVLDHGFPLHRHGQHGAFERAAARGL